MGGAPPVPTLSGKLDALESGRPALSCRPTGMTTLYDAFSASGVGNVTSLSSAALSSLSKTGSTGAPVVGTRRTCVINARGTGAEKRTVIGRIGRQGDVAFSRSQVNSAVKAARTW